MFERLTGPNGEHIKTCDDLTGMKINKLEVIEFKEHKNRKYYWLCRCECGREKIISSERLIYGLTKTCGCLSSELTAKRNYKHGMAKTRLWIIWSSMRERCRNPKSSGFYKYGGRGINICDEWYNDFAVFHDWAIKNGYRSGLSIDRKNNNGNYEPNNCRWVGRYTQANNTRRNVFYKYKGKELTLAQICRIEGVHYKSIWQLINRDGYSLEEAITHKKGGIRNVG